MKKRNWGKEDIFSRRKNGAERWVQSGDPWPSCLWPWIPWGQKEPNFVKQEAVGPLTGTMSSPQQACHLMLVHTRAGNMHVSCSHAITFFRIPVNGKITLSNRSISFHFLCLLVESGIYCSGGWWINPISRMAKNKEEPSMTDWQMHLSSCSLRIPSHYPIRSHQWEQHVALPWVQGRSEREWSIHKGRKVPDRWGCAWGDLLALSCWH